MAQRTILGMALLFLLAGLTGAARADAPDLHKIVAAGARLLDVRTPEEFGAGHLRGAVNIPVAELRARLAEVGPRDRPVVVYCASGVRSSHAAQLLRAAGFTAVYDLGAMSNW